MLEKGFVFRSKGSQECFYVAEQISLVSYTAIKDQSMAKHYVRIEAMDSTGAPKQLKVWTFYHFAIIYSQISA